MMCEDADWVQQVQDRVHWWALVNTVMNIKSLIISRVIFDQLSDYQLSEKDSTPWS
jgi:hypothetical protein